MIIAAALSALLMVGCAVQGTAEVDEETASRQYMSSVNATIDKLSTKLEAFNDAVLDGDVATMQVTVDEALAVLDELEAIEAPEVLAEVQEGYVNGCGMLADALSQYIDLYKDAAGGSLDEETYEARLGEIQQTYDDGIDALKVTDDTAAAL